MEQKSLKYEVFNTSVFALVSLFFFLAINNTAVYGQSEKKIESWFKDARQSYSVNNTEKTIELCNKILKSMPGFIQAHLLLADLYNGLDSTQQEIFHLLEAKESSKNILILYRLAEANYLTGKYSQAENYFFDYLADSSLTENRKNEVLRKIKNCRFAIEAIKNPIQFNPKNLSSTVNSSFDEYWPVLSLDNQKLVFTRLLKRAGELPQEDFYISEFDSMGWGKANAIVELNTTRNEGAQALSADGKILFFTACNRAGGLGSCDIYYSRFVDKKWTTPMNVGKPVNSNYWEAQPSFSSDNRFLYFSSNRPGGKGLKDIWRAELLEINENGELIWAKTENLGVSINSEGNEVSPFIHHNNKRFYFVSDYHTGMGGNDLFFSELLADSIFSEPKNLGYPINTYKDEQGLNISSDGKTAYFASTRKNDTGLDIYSFTLSAELRPDPVSYVQAKVIDAKTKSPVQANVELVNLTNQEIKIRAEKTDNNGEVLLCLPLGANYAFTVSEDGYLFFSQSFQLAEEKTLQKPFQYTIALKPVEIGAEMNLYNIFFQTDSFSILPDSEPELIKLTSFLNNNLSLRVEIQGHTDSTGSRDKNQLLSEKRAQSVANYLVNNGILEDRLKSKGYGQEKPMASNHTEGGRFKNRRTTIRILSK